MVVYSQPYYSTFCKFANICIQVYRIINSAGGIIAIRKGKPFTYQWEKPVSAILDYLKLCDVTIMGASLGGMLAPRAANVHSLTFRLFTEKEDAANHCNMGNTKLLLDTVINWIEMMAKE